MAKTQVRKRNEDGDRLATYPKGQYTELTKDSCDPLTAIIDMGIHSLAGRPPAYADSAEGLALFRQRTVAYFEHLKAVNTDRENEAVLLADIEGWATFLQITRATIWNYRKRGDDWAFFIDRVKTLILTMRKDAAGRFKMPPMVYVFDCVNNFDYVNTNQIELKTETEEKTAPRMSEEELQRIVNERAELDDLED